MIPVSLTLKNFMSYGEEGQTLSFKGLHVVCLSGDNGNGKSALLDAMTWALWGKTRASTVQSVSEDDLIRRFADEMEVRFEFELNDQNYRVVRRRKRGKPGDWQLAQAVEGGQYVPIGGTSREIGRQISQLLSMEYETFLASAYLQQGHADEFTRQKPAQRKQILGEILGLEQYDRLESRARERARELKAAMDELDGQLRILDAQAARRGSVEDELAVTRAEIAILASARSDQEATAAQWRDRRTRLDQLAQRRAEMETSAQRQESELRDARAALVKQQERLQRLVDMIGQRDSIVRDYQSLVNARQKREQLEPQVQEFNDKTAERQLVQSTIDIERTKLEGEARAVEQQELAAVRQVAELDRIKAQISTFTAELEGEPELQAEVTASQCDLEHAREQFEALRARNRELTEALKELAEVLDLLRRPLATCPVCETDLTGTRRERVLAKQESKRAELTVIQAGVQREGVACKRAMESAQSTVKDLLVRRDELTAHRSRLEELIRLCESLRSAPEELISSRGRAAAIQRQLETDDYAHAKRLQRRMLDQELSRLGLIKAEYETVVDRARILAEAEIRHDRLRDAEQHLEPERTELAQREKLAASKLESLAEHRAAMDELTTSLSCLDEVRINSAKADAALALLDGDLADQRRREGAHLGFLEDCERAAQSRKDKEGERKRVHQDYWTYDKLASCFGKKGIQALIIENAIPELEEEANELLARMTDNGMQVRFLTTRSGRTARAEIETLDISITDDAGPRPYELFSGGEAFRVNFAIRIALSRLLATRSGARLQTLILDEGFGTQDGKGREKLVEAIDAIKGDFEKILVITHVEELKDSFPQRIEVSKDGRGSRIYVY